MVRSAFLERKIAKNRRGFTALGLFIAGLGVVVLLIASHFSLPLLGDLLFSIAALLAIPCLGIGIYWNDPKRHPAIRRLQKLYGHELRSIYRQLDEQTRLDPFFKIKSRFGFVEIHFTQDWILFDGPIIAAIPFEKIAWIYGKTIRAEGVRLSGIQIHLTDRSILWVAISYFTFGPVERALAVCRERCPGILTEHTKELERKWRYDSEAFVQRALERKLPRDKAA